MHDLFVTVKFDAGEQEQFHFYGQHYSENNPVHFYSLLLQPGTRCLGYRNHGGVR